MRKITVALLTVLCVLVPVMDLAASGKGEGAAKVDKLVIAQVAYRVHPTENPTREFLEEKMGVKLEFIGAPYDNNQYNAKLSSYLASGAIPDIIYVLGYDDEAKYLKQKLFIPLEDILTKTIKDLHSEEIWNIQTKADGHIYLIPRKGPHTNYNGLMVRKDYLEKFGLGIPNTLDELYEVAKKFALEDPDGDGKNNTYCMSTDKDFMFTKVAFGAYGLSPFEWFEDKNGKLLMGALHPDAKEVLKWYRRLYQEGIMDPDFPLNDAGTAYSGMYNGKLLISEAWGGGMTVGRASLWQKLQQIHPGALLLDIPPVKGPGGKSGIGAVVGKKPFTSIGISVKCKDPELAMSYLDYIASEEGFMRTKFGENGVHYSYKEGDAQLKFLGKYGTPDVMYEIGLDSIYNRLMERHLVHKLDPRNDDLIYNHLMKNIDMSIEPRVVFFADSYTVVPESMTYKDSLLSLLKERMTQIIIDANINVDEAFEKMQKDWFANGGSQWAEAMNKAERWK